MFVSLSNEFLEQFKFVYTVHRCVRLVSYSVLLTVGGLLLWATWRSGVQSWRLLMQLLLSFPLVWSERGAITLLFLSILLVQMLAWLVLWCGFAWTSSTILHHGLQERQKPQDVATQRIVWQRQRPDVDTEK